MTKTNITLTRGKTKISLDLEDQQLLELQKLVAESKQLTDTERALKYLVDSLPVTSEANQ